ncbi:hypothetical protein BJV77DRAFT_344356 [Russula vinacea]|nr:hypothetical protein BJV77DRAFT_344356 [Russula vinacea]
MMRAWGSTTMLVPNHHQLLSCSRSVGLFGASGKWQGFQERPHGILFAKRRNDHASFVLLLDFPMGHTVMNERGFAWTGDSRGGRLEGEIILADSDSGPRPRHPIKKNTAALLRAETNPAMATAYALPLSPSGPPPNTIHLAQQLPSSSRRQCIYPPALRASKSYVPITMRLWRRIAQPSAAPSAPESKLTSGTRRDNDAPPQRRVPRQLDKASEHHDMAVYYGYRAALLWLRYYMDYSSHKLLCRPQYNQTQFPPPPLSIYRVGSKG